LFFLNRLGQYLIALTQSNPLFAITIFAVIIRATLIYLHQLGLSLPETGADATTFLKQASIDANSTWDELLAGFPGASHRLVIWIFAIVLKVVGHDYIWIHALICSLSIIILCMLWGIVTAIFSKPAAIAACLVFAVHPTFILYSIVPLREVFIWFGLTIFILGWTFIIKKQNLLGLLLLALGSTISGMFHGSFFLLLVYVWLVLFIRFLFALNSDVDRAVALVISLCFCFAIMNFLVGVEIPYIGFIGSIDTNLVLEKLAHRFSGFGGLDYPLWVYPTDIYEFFIMTPIFLINFQFGPFLWSITEYKHFFAIYDSIFSCLIFFLACMTLYQQKFEARLIILFGAFLFLLVIYSYGVANFGAVIRHRTKLNFFLLILAAPSLVTCTKLFFRVRS